MSQNKLASASLALSQDRYTLKRIARGIFRRVPIIGKSSAIFLYQKGFKVCFLEENIRDVRLPLFREYARSANLWDQREALFRALVVAAIKEKIIDTRRNFIDIGACNGDTALSWAILIDGVVYAIDPSNANIRYLKSIARCNRIVNIDAFVAAVGEREGLLYPVQNINHTHFTEEPLGRYGAQNPVPATSFDTLHDRGRIKNIGFLHLDVEGMELQALRGGARMLQSERPIVTFECHITIDDNDALIGLLKGLNYSVYMINESTSGGRPDCVNFIAFPAPGVSKIALKCLNSIVPKQEFYKATLGDHLLPVA